MAVKSPKRYCMDRGIIALMERDGIGWGHDLNAGCVTMPLPDRGRSRLGKFYKRLRRGG